MTLVLRNNDSVSFIVFSITKMLETDFNIGLETA